MTTREIHNLLTLVTKELNINIGKSLNGCEYDEDIAKIEINVMRARILARMKCDKKSLNKVIQIDRLQILNLPNQQ